MSGGISCAAEASAYDRRAAPRAPYQIAAASTIVPATNSSTTPGPPSVFNLTDAEVARGRRAKENHGKQLRSNPSVLGVGVGEDPAAPGQAAVIVYLLRGSSRANIARDLDGVSTVIVETDPIVAYGWNEPLGGGGACKVR